MTAYECLLRIIGLCENPHWDTQRRWRIAELARQAMSNLGPPKDYVVKATNERGGVAWLVDVNRDYASWSVSANTAMHWTKERARQLVSQLKTSYAMLGKLEAVKASSKEVSNVPK